MPELFEQLNPPQIIRRRITGENRSPTVGRETAPRGATDAFDRETVAVRRHRRAAGAVLKTRPSRISPFASGP